MTTSATALEKTSFLRLLILGGPRVGKTTSVVSTAPTPIYVINCDAGDGTPLAAAARLTKLFDYDCVRDAEGMNKAIVTARQGIQAGKYKTIVLDSLSSYSKHLIEQCLMASETQAGKENGLVAYGQHNRRLWQQVFSLLRLEAHVIVLSHYEVTTGAIDGQMKKHGDGILPGIAGSGRQSIAGQFSDVLFMDQDQSGERVFYARMKGAWGPGSRSLPGTEVIPADIGKLLHMISEQGKMPGKAIAKPVSKPVGVKR